MGSSDSDSEDEVRVVKSAKAKAREDLDKICDEMRDSMTGNEWAAIQTLWDKLHKQVDKIKKTTGMLGAPRPYIKIITELEDFLAETLAGTHFCGRSLGWLQSTGLSNRSMDNGAGHVPGSIRHRGREVKAFDSKLCFVPSNGAIRAGSNPVDVETFC